MLKLPELPQFDHFYKKVNPNDQKYLDLIEEDEKHSRYLTNKEIDCLINLAVANHNTFKDFKILIPDLNSSTLRQYVVTPITDQEFYRNLRLELSDPYNGANLEITPIFKLINPPENYNKLYEFKNTDKFVLTVHGKNVLYNLEKSNEAIKLAKIAAWGSITGIIVTIILFCVPYATWKLWY